MKQEVKQDVKEEPQETSLSSLFFLPSTPSTAAPVVMTLPKYPRAASEVSAPKATNEEGAYQAGEQQRAYSNIEGTGKRTLTQESRQVREAPARPAVLTWQD